MYRTLSNYPINLYGAHALLPRLSRSRQACMHSAVKGNGEELEPVARVVTLCDGLQEACMRDSALDAVRNKRLPLPEYLRRFLVL